jgi:multidrug resistance efflux pump
LAYVTAKINFQTAVNQYDRTDELFKQGLKSKTDLETKLLKLEQTKAYELEAKNKWLTGKSELINARIQLSNIESKFNADIAKVNSEKFTAMSDMFDSRSMVNKLQNQYANYEIRNGMYFITAPQDGFITKTLKNGIGETIKEGSQIMSIMPAEYQLAIEMFVAPIDLPLIERGQHVRIIFDGWPAIVFSGWPNSSFGTFGGTVFAIDQFISDNGKYRVLVKPDETESKWPRAIRFGGGANNMLLLQDVPIWYELWRKINGFPPNYYKKGNSTKEKK